MRNRSLAATGLGALALLAAACGSSAPATSAPHGPAAGDPAVGAQVSGAPAAAAQASGASASTTSGTSSTTVKTAKIGAATVLTNAKGFTLYTFALDTTGKSNCNGSCVHYWPPLHGPATAGHGVTGKLGTIKRSDGSTQVTYNGHPVYTYVGDTAPGQAHGNGLNLSGGIWHEVPVAGMVVPAPAHSSSSGGGY